ncbi:MAG: hypothetical protein ABWX92_03720 [Mycetocola sp.]
MGHRIATQETETGRNFRGIILLSIGSVLVLAAAALLALTLLAVSTIQSDALARLNDGSITYHVAFGLVERELSPLSMMTAFPAGLLLAATCFLIPGYLRRRGFLAARDTTVMRGGSTTAKYKPLPIGLHAAWLLAPLAAWVLLIVIPLNNLIDGTAWPAGLQYDDATAVWMLLAAYGGLAAGLFAVVLVSLVKKIVYRHHIERHPEHIEGSADKGFWRWITFRWRVDLWLAGLGGALLGLCGIALGFSDILFFTNAFSIGVLLVAAGGVLTVNYWRAGEPLGAAESYS